MCSKIVQWPGEVCELSCGCWDCTPLPCELLTACLVSMIVVFYFYLLGEAHHSSCWRSALPYVGSGDGAQVLRPSGKHLRLLNHLSSPRTVVLLLLGWIREVTSQANIPGKHSSIEVNPSPHLSFKLFHSILYRFAVRTRTHRVARAVLNL